MANLTLIEAISSLNKLNESFNAYRERVDVNIDAFFLVTMSIVVYLMQCGFAFIEAGSVRSKNTIDILLKNLLTSLITCVVYFFCGWAFAFGNKGNPYIGFGQFLLLDLEAPKYPLWFFHFVFAATASTIVSGAVAERCEMIAYLLYSVLLTGLVYPVITHWTWDSSGWLANGPDGIKFKDFAGSACVHLHGGTVALIGMIFLGPRIGRFEDKKTGRPAVPLKGHSAPFVVLGAFMLLVGFFGFNGGSQGSLARPGDGDTVARACVNTILCSGWATLAVLFCNKFFFSKNWSLLCSINAALTGMVAACSGCDALEPWTCSVVGSGAGFMYFFTAMLVEKLQIDDPVDTVAIHCGGGLWGLLITPVMMNGGIIYEANRLSFLQLGWNALGGLAIVGWSLITMGALFLILKLTGKLRVPAEVELRGLDEMRHGGAAYPTEFKDAASRKISKYGDDPLFLAGAVTAQFSRSSGLDNQRANYDNQGYFGNSEQERAMHLKNRHSYNVQPVKVDQGESVTVTTRNFK
uniref:Ammonium transporter n=1 Tax=Plectus sambesii TaxID=2011161 RepID=A0A914VTF0_9BILA